MSNDTPSSLLLGRLSRQTLINAQGQALIDQPGGNLLYAAAGARLWKATPGLVARVGADYPREWLDQFEGRGFDTRGIRFLDAAIDLRQFIAYSDVETPSHEGPIRHFARLGLPLPKILLGYQASPDGTDSRRERGPLSLRPADLPDTYQGVTHAHFCPLDFLSHSLMPAALREAGIRSISLDAGQGYMSHDFLEEMPALLNGLAAFLATEAQLRALYSGRMRDLWEAAAALAAYNCPVIVVKRQQGGQLLYDAEAGRRYQVPAYPAMPRDITGQSSSFSGGFHAGMQLTGDFLQATLMGNVAASLASAGSGPFYVLEGLTGLAESRLATLAGAVKIV
jgi:ribokinase